MVRALKFNGLSGERPTEQDLSPTIRVSHSSTERTSRSRPPVTQLSKQTLRGHPPSPLSQSGLSFSEPKFSDRGFRSHREMQVLKSESLTLQLTGWVTSIL